VAGLWQSASPCRSCARRSVRDLRPAACFFSFCPLSRRLGRPALWQQPVLPCDELNTVLQKVGAARTQDDPAGLVPTGAPSQRDDALGLHRGDGALRGRRRRRPDRARAGAPPGDRADVGSRPRPISRTCGGRGRARVGRSTGSRSCSAARNGQIPRRPKTPTAGRSSSTTKEPKPSPWTRHRQPPICRQVHCYIGETHRMNCAGTRLLLVGSIIALRPPKASRSRRRGGCDLQIALL
jgi:hypothetical protein